jgi:hypothetical protein
MDLNRLQEEVNTLFHLRKVKVGLIRTNILKIPLFLQVDHQDGDSRWSDAGNP